MTTYPTLHELNYNELFNKIWTPGELAEYWNLKGLRYELRHAMSISPFDTKYKIADDLLKKARRIQRQNLGLK